MKAGGSDGRIVGLAVAGASAAMPPDALHMLDPARATGDMIAACIAAGADQRHGAATATGSPLHRWCGADGASMEAVRSLIAAAPDMVQTAMPRMGTPLDIAVGSAHTLRFVRPLIDAGGTFAARTRDAVGCVVCHGIPSSETIGSATCLDAAGLDDAIRAVVAAGADRDDGDVWMVFGSSSVDWTTGGAAERMAAVAIDTMLSAGCLPLRHDDVEMAVVARAMTRITETGRTRSATRAAWLLGMAALPEDARPRLDQRVPPSGPGLDDCIARCAGLPRLEPHVLRMLASAAKRSTAGDHAAFDASVADVARRISESCETPF